MKRYKSNTIKKKLDDLVGGYFRSRPCDYHKNRKGCVGSISWCHIKSRKYLSTRWLLINAFSLCSKQHFYFTNNPDDFMRWIDLNYPTRLDALQKVFIINRPIKDWELVEMYENLNNELTP